MFVPLTPDPVVEPEVVGALGNFGAGQKTNASATRLPTNSDPSVRRFIVMRVEFPAGFRRN